MAAITQVLDQVYRFAGENLPIALGKGATTAMAVCKALADQQTCELYKTACLDWFSKPLLSEAITLNPSRGATVVTGAALLTLALLAKYCCCAKPRMRG